uniref:Putative methyltransferase n=1 Tax=viral metagenome TaxID=1070528 RepID=A0A6M3JVV2_9ZZZZ
MTRTPIPWYGGKSRFTKWIIGSFPPQSQYDQYVEVFGGSGAVLIAKQPSPLEVYNDLNHGLVNFFRVLRDEEKLERLMELCRLTPYSREEYGEWRQYHDDSGGSIPDPSGDVEVAHRWFYIIRSTFGATHSWGYSKKLKAVNIRSYRAAIERLPEVCERLLRVQVECDDALSVIERYDHPRTLFYLDPPYVLSTRTASTSTYEHETDEGFHEKLVEVLLSIKGMAVLSGYGCELYKRLEDAGWRTREREVSASVVRDDTGKDKTRVETLWLSPNIQGAQLEMWRE